MELMPIMNAPPSAIGMMINSVQFKNVKVLQAYSYLGRKGVRIVTY
jgi:hypothetical protein